MSLKSTGNIVEDNGSLIIEEFLLNKIPVFIYKFTDPLNLSVEVIFDTPNFYKYIDSKYARSKISAVLYVSDSEMKKLIASGKKLSKSIRQSIPQTKETFHTVAVIKNNTLIRAYNILKKVGFKSLDPIQIISDAKDVEDKILSWHNKSKG